MHKHTFDDGLVHWVAAVFVPYRKPVCNTVGNVNDATCPVCIKVGNYAKEVFKRKRVS